MSPEELFLSHLGLIEKVVAYQCRRYHFQREETEDIASMVKLKLIDNDYDVLRRFQGKSRIETYLNVVVQRQLLDHFNHIRGKKHPSAEARRRGEVAIQLEKLLVRDGMTFEEACEMLRTNFGFTESREELEEIAWRLPRRGGRRFEDDSALETLCSPDSSPEQRLRERELGPLADRVNEALTAAIRELEPREQLIAKQIGLKVQGVEIARALGIDQKKYYRLAQKVLKKLRKALARKGIHREDIEELLAGGAVQLGGE